MKKSITGKNVINKEEQEILNWCQENSNLISRLINNDSLASIIKEVKEEDIAIFTSGLTSNYVNRRMTDSGRIWFEFEQINEHHELYNQNYLTIKSYYNNLLAEYVFKTGLPYEMAKKDFDLRTGTLSDLVEFVSKSCSGDLDENISINRIINYDYWNSSNLEIVRTIKKYLLGVYMPNYYKKYVIIRNAVTELHPVMDEEEEIILAWIRKNITLVNSLMNSGALSDFVRTISDEDVELLEWTKENEELINKLMYNSEVTDFTQSVEEEDISLFEWAKENEELVTLLMDNDELASFVQSVDEDDIELLEWAREHFGRVHYEFEHVKESDPLYDQNAWTIEGYYAKLVNEYMTRTGLDYDDASEEFETLTVSFEKIVSALLECFEDYTVEANSSIRQILTSKSWDEDERDEVRYLSNCLRGLYLPNYNKRIENPSNDTNKRNELLKMQNEVLKAQVEYLKGQLASMGQVEVEKQKSI